MKQTTKTLLGLLALLIIAGADQVAPPSSDSLKTIPSIGRDPVGVVQVAVEKRSSCQAR